MSLRLASRFLALDNVVRHIVIMADGLITVLPNTKSLLIARSPGPKKHPNDHSPDLPKDCDNYYHWRANEILQQAAEHIRFIIDKVQEVGKGGHTAHREGPWPLARASKFSAPGVGSDIHIGGASWRRLQRAHNNRAGRLCDRFEIARVVVHELAHALENLFTGWRRAECFCENNALSERGYDMELAIFGGFVDINFIEVLLEGRRNGYCFSSPKRVPTTPCMVFYEWPNTPFADMYAWRRLKMGTLLVEKSDNARRVPLSFVESLFTDAYWATVGSSALVVPQAGDFWPVRWFESANGEVEGIHLWLTRREYESGAAANQR